MASSPVTFNILQPLQVQAHFTPKIAFDDILPFLDGVNDLGKLLFVQILRADIGIDAGLLQYLFRVGGSNSINVTQSNLDPLGARDINSNYTRHTINESTLTLFVPGVGANDANDTLSADDLAMLTEPFD